MESGWMQGTLLIVAEDGRDTRPVPARFRGGLAVHRCCDTGEDGEALPGWTVTHAGTGIAMDRYGDRDAAFRAAEAALGCPEWAALRAIGSYEEGHALRAEGRRVVRAMRAAAAS